MGEEAASTRRGLEAKRQHKLITKANALSYAVSVDPSKQDQTAANRIARIFKAHGWVRARHRVNGERLWHYRPPLGDGHAT